MSVRKYWNNLELSTRFILLTGLLIQIITAINAIGYLHPDQHFQIIEFAGFKLGLTDRALLPGDFDAQYRPSLQVYIFIVYYKLLQLVNLDDPFTAMLILRIIIGVLNFSFFNFLIYREFRERGTFFINGLLVVSCFSWSMPFIRTLFSAEVLGGLVFYGAIYLYQKYSSKKGGLIIASAIGVILAIAFYIRFQLGFALVGFAIWLLFVDRISMKTAMVLIGGFVIGIAINFLLDGLYYGSWVLTPYNYFKFNILEGGASGFGESSVWYYIGILAGLLTAPPLSILLFFLLIFGSVKRLSSVYTLTTLFFLLVHFMVGHKEERFLFSVVGVLPIILGYGMLSINLDRMSNWLTKGIKATVGVSLLLNFVLLFIMATIPVSQNLEFVRKLNGSFENDQNVIIKYYKRSPLETPTARNLHRFYEHGLKKNIRFEKIDSLTDWYASIESGGPNTYYALTYDVIVHEHIQLDPGCSEVLHSSALFTRFNQWLYKTFDLVVAENWILYQCKGGQQ